MSLGLKVDMIFGPTKSTKTSRLGDAIEYHYGLTGKPARGVFSDTGGYEAIAYLKDEKKLIPFVLSAAARGDRLIEDMDKLSRGWWPKDPEDPKSILEYGKLDDVSLFLYDGATSWCSMLLSYHEAAVKYMPQTDTIAATTVRSPDMPKDSFVRSGDFLRRFTGKSDYGAVQGRISEFIRNTAMLPAKSIWTALVTKGTDDYSKTPVFGPDFVGSALTGKCGPWFANLLHLDFVPAQREEVVDGQKFKIIEAKPFLFTRSHINPEDPTKTPYMAGSRVDKRIWQKVPSVMAPDLAAFYRLIDKLAEEAKGMGSPIVQGVRG